jgi:uncharacterized protein (TIGR02466 family)
LAHPVWEKAVLGGDVSTLALGVPRSDDSGPAPDAAQHIVGHKGGPIFAFPTVCYTMEHQGVEELNRELKRLVLDEKEHNESLPQGSIRGGYHSHHGILAGDNWAVQGLRQLIKANFGEYLTVFWGHESREDLANVGKIGTRISAWSVILRAGSVSISHVHPNANVSGVYYVSIPEGLQDAGKEAGNLVLQDPRPMPRFAPIRGQSSYVSITPKEGMLVMFPSYMEHYVMPFYSEGERISIAFNIHLSENAIHGF